MDGVGSERPRDEEEKTHRLFLFLLSFPPPPQLLNQYDCVTTPAEFAAAFKANTPRCVSEDLVGRLSSGNSVAQAANRSVSFSL